MHTARHFPGSFDNIQILGFREFGWKISIHAAIENKNFWGFDPQN